ncbi:unnamed protein product [Mytilus edulis]|uniref:Uncharacterized protein n=1 Tax=Mytilus edulis TaxID=6550 RepID=A0A8S3TTQ9_MYTED|nr:unnamed protein product [Mytilus edulis]
MVDLKEHVMANHRSKIELMPYSFLRENNGFWMANYPETYAKVILPSNETSQEAMKARIEVLEFLNRVDNTNRKKEDWTLGWKCPKEMVRGTQEEEVESEKPNGFYSPTRPTIYEGLALQQLTLGLGDSTAIFKLDLGVDHKMLDALIRRMTALVNTTYAGSHTFSVSIDGKPKSIVTPVVARNYRYQSITDIKTSDELFPGKQTKAVTNQLSPLKTPSTSDIILEDDSDNEEPEILEEATSQKENGKQEQEEIKRKEEDHKKRETQKQEEDVRLKEAEQKRKEKQEQEDIKRKEEEHKKRETQKQEEEVKQKEAEKKRKEKMEQEEIRRKEEERKKQEKQKQEEEVRLKEAEQTRKEKQEQEEIRQKEEERKKQENRNRRRKSD